MRITAFHLLTVLMQLSAFVSASTINVPADHSTIQAALNAADSSDTVLVQPGTYYENIFWPDVNGIKLISAGDSSNTIIDGSANGSVIYMNPMDATIDSTTEIRGFKITNGGNIANGGGMFVSNASPVLTQLWVTGNTASNYGGGLYINYGSPTLMDVTVTGNTASYHGGGLYINDSSPTLSYVTVTSNSASYYGGGLYILSSSPTLTDVTVTGNTAGSAGGGLYISGGSPTLTDGTVTDNTAGEDGGGGIYCDGSSLSLVSMIVTGNTAYYGGRGGGLSILGCSPTLTDVIVTGNTASGFGGGLYISGSPPLTHVTVTGNTAHYGGGLYISGGLPSLRDVTVTGNTASGYGGGLYIYSSICGGLCDDVTYATLTDVTVTGNTAHYGGGGLYINYGSPTLTDVTVTDNTAGSAGGGLYIKSGSPSLTDVIVTGNTAYTYGGGLYIIGSPALMRITVSRNLGEGLFFRYGSGTLVNSTITGNTSGIYVKSGAPTIAGSNIAYHGTGLYNADNTNTVDADSVWWGHSSGPYHPNFNLSGLGDSVNAFIDITPWLTEPDTAAPPIPVQNLVVTSQGNDFIELAWDASPIGDLAGYRIYLDTDSTGFPYADTVDVGNTTSVILSNLEPGLTYFIAATCYDTDGNESWYSKEVSATPRDLMPPSVPNGVVAVAGDSSVTLAWSPNSELDLSHYVVYQNTTAGFTPTSADSAARVNAPDTSITLTGLANDTTYYFRITAVDSAGNYSGFSAEVSATPVPLAVDSDVGVPGKFALHQNYPNPFNPSTTLRFDLSEAADVYLVVYDLLGREVVRLVDRPMAAGYHRVIWNGCDRVGRYVPSGIYIVRVRSTDDTKAIKIILMK